MLFLLLPVVVCDGWLFLDICVMILRVFFVFFLNFFALAVWIDFICVSSQTACQGNMENLLRQPYLQIDWAELKPFKADLKLLLEHPKLKTPLSIEGWWKRVDRGFVCTAFGIQAQTQAWFWREALPTEAWAVHESFLWPIRNAPLPKSPPG